MSKHRFLSLILTLLFIIGLSAGPAAAQGNRPDLSATLAGTAFTYQGQLKDGSGNPVTATCAFNFSLWDSLSNSTGQIGSTLNKTSVQVSNGLFSVQLDFGANAFTGNARWLEIAVKCGSDGGFAPLTPRQPLTPAPFAIYSLNAAKLNGLPASAFQQHYANILVVAKSGGDFTTITAALNSITTASATNPFLVYVAPGVYTETVTMKPYVDIEGAGELTTKITYTGSSFNDTGTVVGADNAELRFLTVENTGGASRSVAISNQAAAPRLTHITVSATGGTDDNFGVFNYISSPTMTNVNASASGGTNNYGVYNEDSSVVILNSVISGTSGSGNNDGIHNQAQSSGVYTVSIDASQITGSTSTIYQSDQFTTHIGASKLVGGGVTGGGTYTCAASYDGNNVPLGNDCKSIHKNRLVVAKSGGDYTSVTAALNSISDASATNPYLIYVAPGVYNEEVIMKDYVDIEGAGEQATKITFGGTNSSFRNATLVGSNNVEIRYLTVENTGSNGDAVGIYASGLQNFYISHTTVNASGATTGTNIGIDFVQASKAYLDEDHINVTGSTNVANDSIGILTDTYANNISSNQVTIYTASPSTKQSNAIKILGGWLIITDSYLQAYNGAFVRGIYAITNNFTPIFVNMDRSSIQSGAGVYQYPIEASGSTVSVKVGSSLLEYGSVNIHDGGSLTCVGDYDGNYSALNSTCQ